MRKRLGMLGIVLIVVGVGFAVGGGVAYTKVQAGYHSLEAFSKAQNVQLNYNDKGQLIDRGDTDAEQVASAKAIMTLLKDDWKYPVVDSDLDPNNPLVNSGTEYMYQMATIAHHTLTGTQQVTLKEDAQYNGKTYAAGTPIPFAVDNRYWTGFDRTDPVQGAARDLAWSGTTHALIAELGVGSVTSSTLQMGLGLAALLGGLGVVFMMMGGGLIFVGRGKDKILVPNTVPEAFVADQTTDTKTLDKV